MKTLDSVPTAANKLHRKVNAKLLEQRWTKMGKSKNATLVLILAAIFMLISSVAEIIEMFYYSSTYGYNYYEIVDFIGPVTGIIAALLLIIGFMALRNSD
jgi:hypothetical protein